MRLLATSLCFAAVSLVSRPALADVYTLFNDSVEDGDEVAFQQGFVTGESAAATLGEVSDTFTVRKVLFLFGPAGPPLEVNVAVHADVGTDMPGALLYQGNYTITPADNALHEIDLTGENVEHIGPGSIRVVIGVMHDGAPGVARDDDGCQRSLNWIELAAPPSWVSSCEQGVAGDWVIRAEIDGPPARGEGGAGEGGSGEGGAGDGGAPAVSGGGPAGGAANAGGSNAGGAGSDGAGDDGCGCRLAGAEHTTPAWLGVALALAALRRRRGQ
jgi:MYXO-CTERM domain-containing protein